MAGRVSTRGVLEFLRSPWGITLAAVAATGIALRVWVYTSSLATPLSDEAVVGLMARHIIHGQITTFYWGQAYGGPQEALLTVPGFVLFGSSWFALRIVPALLVTVAAVLIWRVGLRTIGQPAALAAAALFWIWPTFVLFYTTYQFDFYASGLVYCALLLLLALRIVERPDPVRVGLFGLVFGLAFWQTAQIVPVAAGIILWTVWKQRRALRQLPVAVPLALLGALPWIVWNVGHHWGSLRLDVGENSTYIHRIRVFVSPLVPMLTGLRVPYSQDLLLPGPVTYLIYAGLVALFAYGAWRARHRPSSVLFVTAAVFPIVYAIAPQTFLTLDPRNLVILSPVLALLGAQLMVTLPRAVAILALVTVVGIVTLHKLETRPITTGVAPRNMTPLIDTLDRLHVRYAYADYWAAYVLDFDSRERIIAVENKFHSVTFSGGLANLPSDPKARQPAYEREVAAHPHGFIFFRSIPTPNRRAITAALVRHGFTRHLVGPFVVYAPPG